MKNKIVYIITLKTIKSIKEKNLNKKDIFISRKKILCSRFIPNNKNDDKNSIEKNNLCFVSINPKIKIIVNNIVETTQKTKLNITK